MDSGHAPICAEATTAPKSAANILPTPKPAASTLPKSSTDARHKPPASSVDAEADTDDEELDIEVDDAEKKIIKLYGKDKAVHGTKEKVALVESHKMSPTPATLTETVSPWDDSYEK